MSLPGIFFDKNMKYSKARPSIKSGDLLAWSHRGWRSWHDIKIQLVRAFTQSEYSHVGIAWVVGERVFVLESVMPLSRIYPLSKLGDFFHIPMGVKWAPYTEAFALSMIGKPYSQFNAICAAFSKIDQESVSECAAYVIQVLRKDGIDLGPIAVPSSVVNRALGLGKTLTLVEAV